MATRKFQTNPHALLFSCFKYLIARDFNTSILKGPISRFQGITVIHNKWNKKSFGGCAFWTGRQLITRCSKLIFDSKTPRTTIFTGDSCAK